MADRIDPKLSLALAQAFGGAQKPQPAAPASAGPAGGFFSSLFGPSQPKPQPVDPYMNFANKATGRPHR